MASKKPTIEDMKKQLDEHEIDYSAAKKHEDYVELMKQIEVAEENHEEVETQEPTEHEEVSEPVGVLGKVQAAKKVEIERTVTKKTSDTDYLIGRDYDELTAGERLIIREKSPEYESEETGVKVHVTARLITNWRIVKLHDRSYSKLLKGEIYTLSQEDYEVLKDEKVKVKTEATKNKCCGQAVYEQIPLLEVLNG
jgi:Phosphoribosylformylglycinamidine (FGAM) synthase, synthetase domain